MGTLRGQGHEFAAHHLQANVQALELELHAVTKCSRSKCQDEAASLYAPCPLVFPKRAASAVWVKRNSRWGWPGSPMNPCAS